MIYEHSTKRLTTKNSHEVALSNYSTTTVIKNSSLDAEILSAMMAESTVFSIRGSTATAEITNLMKHVAARKTIVNNAINSKVSLSRNGVSTTIFELYDMWQKARATTPQQMWDAMNNANTLMGCQQVTERIMDTGSIDGDNTNNAHRSLSVWIPGDHGYIINPGHATGSHSNDLLYAGENVIYVGSDKWWGHPRTIQSLTEWEMRVTNWDGVIARLNKQKIYYTRVGLDRK